MVVEITKNLFSVEGENLCCECQIQRLIECGEISWVMQRHFTRHPAVNSRVNSCEFIDYLSQGKWRLFELSSKPINRSLVD
ncbi:hypothetical protein CHUAL_009830 [Chamberlinius hualienensis]